MEVKSRMMHLFTVTQIKVTNDCKASLHVVRAADGDASNRLGILLNNFITSEWPQMYSSGSPDALARIPKTD